MGDTNCEYYFLFFNIQNPEEKEDSCLIKLSNSSNKVYLDNTCNAEDYHSCRIYQEKTRGLDKE